MARVAVSCVTIALGVFTTCAAAWAYPSSVVVALPVKPSGSDPRDVADDALARSLERMRFLSLVQVGVRGELKNTLAQQVVSDGPLSWRVVLRKHIRFRNGRDVGADDVVATYEALRASGSPRAQQLSNVVSVNKTSNGDVVFALREPDVRFESKLDAGILPKEALLLPRQDILGMNFESGPYYALKISESNWVLHRNDSYSAEKLGGLKPSLKMLSLKFISDGAVRYQSLIKGKVDIVVDGLSMDKIVDLNKFYKAKIHVASGVSAQNLGVGFVKSHPTVAREDVRSKILCAVDFLKIERFSLGPLVSRLPNVQFPSCDGKTRKSDLLSLTVDTTAVFEEIVLAKGIAAELQKKGSSVDVRVQTEENLLSRIESGQVSVFVSYFPFRAEATPPEFEKNTEKHLFWNRNVFVAMRKPFQNLKPNFDGGVDFLVFQND